MFVGFVDYVALVLLSIVFAAFRCWVADYLVGFDCCVLRCCTGLVCGLLFGFRIRWCFALDWFAGDSLFDTFCLVGCDWFLVLCFTCLDGGFAYLMIGVASGE